MSQKLRWKIKSYIRRRFPELNATILEPWLQWRYKRAMASMVKVRSKVLEKIGCEVQRGPFRSLQYIPEARNSGFTSKLIGCYESEIQWIIEEVIAKRYDVILDVGCAEGYYAVGLAVRCPQARVYAYDVDEKCRELCERLAELNGVGSRIEVRRRCDHQELNGIQGSSVFLLCDAEGFERELLNPVIVPALCDWDILVELHDSSFPGTTRSILERFSGTHAISLLDSTDRDPMQYPEVNFLASRLERIVAVSDLRGSWQQWAWMQSKQRRDHRFK